MLYNHREGQSTFEFTFGMICAVLLVMGMVKVFLWTGKDLILRRQAHEKVLFEPVCDESACILRQIRPRFFEKPPDMNAMVNSNIYGDTVQSIPRPEL